MRRWLQTDHSPCRKTGAQLLRPLEFLDLLATAIAADIVPMVGENRILVYHGLKKANEEPNYGIRALKELGGVQKELFINNLVFMIAPRVNAAGRMDDGSKAVQLFLAKNIDEARQYAAMLHSDNSDRKEADKNITDEALAIISGDLTMAASKSTVVYQPHWHKGVVGIVASRLIDHYYRPTIVLTQSGEYIAGSARSVAGFNVYEAIHQCRDLLLGYGGHFYAAGMTLEPGKVDAFRARFRRSGICLHHRRHADPRDQYRCRGYPQRPQAILLQYHQTHGAFRPGKHAAALHGQRRYRFRLLEDRQGCTYPFFRKAGQYPL